MLGGGGGVLGGGPFDGLRTGCKDAVDAVERCHASADGIRGLGEVLGRVDDAIEDNKVINESGGIDTAMVAENESSTIPKQDGNHSRAEEFGDRMRKGIFAVEADEGLAGTVVE